MLQLTYLSTAAQPFDERRLTELLGKSRANNEALGVTGMLVHHHGLFLQVLEGLPHVVDALYERIALDPRHQNAEVLMRVDVDEPTFVEWSMGFFNADVAELDALPGFVDFFGRKFQRRTLVDHPAAACKLLLAFRDGRLRPAVEVGEAAIA